MTFEVPGEMRLIVEADAGRDLGHGLAVEQASARGLDPSPDQVAVRRDPEPVGEAPHQVCG